MEGLNQDHFSSSLESFRLTLIKAMISNSMITNTAIWMVVEDISVLAESSSSGELSGDVPTLLSSSSITWSPISTTKLIVELLLLPDASALAMTSV